MAPATLPYDVLIHTFSFVDERTHLLACMGTCKLLREGGIPILLSRPIELRGYPRQFGREASLAWDDRPMPLSIVVSNAQKINQFCRFLLADEKRRPRLVRELYVDLDPDHPLPSIDLLYSTMELCTMIRRLGLPYCDDLLAIEPKLGSVIRTFINVRELEIDGVFESIEFLATLKLPITHVWYSDIRQDMSEGNFLCALQSLAPSIERLVTNFMPWAEIPPEDIFPLPKLSHLSLLQASLPDMGVLVQICPRLKSLLIKHCCEPEYEDVDFVRLSSIHSQQQHRWSCLERYEGNGSDLFLLSPQFKIISLIIKSIYPRSRTVGDYFLFDWLRNVLRNCTPINIDCTTDSEVFFEDIWKDMFSYPELKRLSLNFSHLKSGALDIILDGIIASVEGSAIEEFNLSLRWPVDFSQDTQEERIASPEPLDGFPRRSIAPVMAFVSELPRHVPSLSTISCYAYFKAPDYDSMPDFESPVYKWAVIRNSDSGEFRVEAIL